MPEMVSVTTEAITHLPPRDAWIVPPEKVKKFYAPTDSRGFVLPDATIETVLGLFDEGYDWPVDWSKEAPHILRPDDHHFHWTAQLYARQNFKGRQSDVPKKFRQLPTNRGIIPRQFHNVIHEVTIPPVMPKIAHMDHYLRSFEVACQLFESAQKALQAESLFMGTDEEEKLERYLNRYEDVFNAYRKRSMKAMGISALEMIGVRDVDFKSMEEVKQRLGSCALLNVPNYTCRYFTETVETAA